VEVEVEVEGNKVDKGIVKIKINQNNQIQSNRLEHYYNNTLMKSFLKKKIRRNMKVKYKI
jgi:hypothetical protein